MSEPTYRVELTYTRPGTPNPWVGEAFRVRDDFRVFVEYGTTREQAFDRIRLAIQNLAHPAEEPSTVLLTEDGDILDPHEVQR